MTFWMIHYFKSTTTTVKNSFFLPLNHMQLIFQAQPSNELNLALLMCWCTFINFHKIWPLPDDCSIKKLFLVSFLTTLCISLTPIWVWLKLYYLILWCWHITCRSFFVSNFSLSRLSLIITIEYILEEITTSSVIWCIFFHKKFVFTLKILLHIFLHLESQQKAKTTMFWKTLDQLLNIEISCATLESRSCSSTCNCFVIVLVSFQNCQFVMSSAQRKLTHTHTHAQS